MLFTIGLGITVIGLLLMAVSNERTSRMRFSVRNRGNTTDLIEDAAVVCFMIGPFMAVVSLLILIVPLMWKFLP